MPEYSFKTLLDSMNKDQMFALLYELEKDLVYTTARAASELGNEYLLQATSLVEAIKTVKAKLHSIQHPAPEAPKADGLGG